VGNVENLIKPSLWVNGSMLLKFLNKVNSSKTSSAPGDEY